MIAPEAFTRKAKTTLGERIAAITPANPTAPASSTARAGTWRRLVRTSQRGASPRLARTNSTREATYKAELRHDSTAVRITAAMNSLAYGKWISSSARVNGD